jgi:hypothetical protein
VERRLAGGRLRRGRLSDVLPDATLRHRAAEPRATSSLRPSQSCPIDPNVKAGPPAVPGVFWPLTKARQTIFDTMHFLIEFHWYLFIFKFAFFYSLTLLAM